MRSNEVQLWSWAPGALKFSQRVHCGWEGETVCYTPWCGVEWRWVHRACLGTDQPQQGRETKLKDTHAKQKWVSLKDTGWTLDWCCILQQDAVHGDIIMDNRSQHIYQYYIDMSALSHFLCKGHASAKYFHVLYYVSFFKCLKMLHFPGYVILIKKKKNQTLLKMLLWVLYVLWWNSRLKEIM